MISPIATTAAQLHSSTPNDLSNFVISLFTAIGGIGAAVSALASLNATRQLTKFERPILIVNFSVSSDGKVSTISISNVGKRTTNFILILAATRDTFIWGQLPEAVRPNEPAIKITTSKLRVKLNDVPLAKVVVSCVDSMEDIQLAWSLDRRLKYKSRPRSHWTDGLDGIKEIFEMLYPDEKLDDKTKVDI